MADIRRSVKTSFWSDDWVESLSVEERYFFLYLLTNEKTKISGFYEISIKRMSFETGLTADKIKDIILKFSENNKVYYDCGYIQILNFVKNQELNTNMQKSIVNHLKKLPKALKGFERLSNDSKHFETLRKKEKEKEKERENENEKEKEKEKEIGEFNELLNSQPDNPTPPNQERDFFLWDYFQSEANKLLHDNETLHAIKAPEKFEHYIQFITARGLTNPKAAIKSWIKKDLNQFIEVNNE